MEKTKNSAKKLPKIQIIPSILVHNEKDLRDRILSVQGLVEVVQIDVADNKFVPNKTVQYEEIRKVMHELNTTSKIRTKVEAHLMVKDPENYIKRYSEFCETIIFHYEAGKENSLNLIKEIRKLKKRAGIAMNPDTKISEVKYLLGEVDEILFMTVYPGFSGQKFLPEVLPKIKEVRRLFPSVDIEVDGGLGIGTAKLSVQSGANIICGASAIYSRGDVPRAVKKLKEDAESGLE